MTYEENLNPNEWKNKIPVEDVNIPYFEEMETTENKPPIDWDNLVFKELKTDALQWKPEPNDYILGEYIKTEEGTGKKEGLIFHILEDPDGQRVSLLGCTVLNDKFREIRLGTPLKIVYNGYKDPIYGGKPYKDYTFYIGE